MVDVEKEPPAKPLFIYSAPFHILYFAIVP